MATPVGGLYAYSIRAFHDSAYDLPEDFFERIEGDLDAETRARYAAGFRHAKAVTQVRGRGSATLVAGVVVLMASGLVAYFAPALFLAVALLGAATVAAGILLYGYAYALYLAHREEIHGFLSFVQATRRSSLGRDAR